MSLEDYRTWFFESLLEQKDDATGDSLYRDQVRSHLHRDSLPFLESLPMDFQSILDVGCGAGFDCQWLAEQGKSVIGLTGNSTPAQHEFAEANGFEIRDMDMHALDFDDESFDAILCKHTLEHSISPLGALWEMRRVLRPGGYMFLVVPPHHRRYVESGHFTQGWSIGQLIYCLAVTSYDVAGGAFRERKGHVEAVVRRDERGLAGRALYDIRPIMPEPIQQIMRESKHGAFPARYYTQIAWPFAGASRTTTRRTFWQTLRNKLTKT